VVFVRRATRRCVVVALGDVAGCVVVGCPGVLLPKRVGAGSASVVAGHSQRPIGRCFSGFTEVPMQDGPRCPETPQRRLLNVAPVLGGG
jgi:hypothetical protein